jgi:hypothetical protein
MNRVIESLMVNNPCTSTDSSAQAATDAVKDYNRAAEQQRSGRFELEEGIQAMLTQYEPSTKWTLDNIKELNQSLEALVNSNKVRRNPNNIRSQT